MKRAASSHLSCSIALPADFRSGDLLAFHGRDAQAVAEQVDANGLAKGLSWEGRAACLSIRFAGSQAAVELSLDGATAPIATAADLERLARRMLGLTQPVARFERRYRKHPQLGPLIACRPGLRVPLLATPFEALIWAVTGQQISLGAAISVRRRLIRLCGLRHSSGLTCHPDAARLAALSEAQLREAGYSQTKARALMLLASEVAAGRLPLEAWCDSLPIEEIRQSLLRLPGIGPWTVNYTLLRGFGWLDGSLHGDVAVRRKLQHLLGALDPIDEGSAQRWLEPFSPWRALVAAHLWAMPKSRAIGCI